MRRVILRDDDTNALTPVECLERLYRPFLRLGLPVNLAVIPEVRTDVTLPDGRREGFLHWGRDRRPGTVPLAANSALVDYLRDNPGFRVVQHGCHHDRLEFDIADEVEIRRRLARGSQRLQEAGFAAPRTFVAPYDRLSVPALKEVAHRFEVLSTGWFELRRLPVAWWPRYVCKKLRQRSHWRMGRIRLLSHPGCLLSYQRPYAEMPSQVRAAVESSQLLVLVTHWWEYFRDGVPDEAFIRVLHNTAHYLANRADLRVTTFDDLAASPVPAD